MYHSQIGKSEHFYRLRFSSGHVHRGETAAGNHLFLMAIFFEGQIAEEIFASRISKKANTRGCSIDELIDEELDSFVEINSRTDDSVSGLVRNDNFIKWMIAREKLLDRDERKIVQGSA